MARKIYISCLILLAAVILCFVFTPVFSWADSFVTGFLRDANGALDVDVVAGGGGGGNVTIVAPTDAAGRVIVVTPAPVPTIGVQLFNTPAVTVNNAPTVVPSCAAISYPCGLPTPIPFPTFGVVEQAACAAAYPCGYPTPIPTLAPVALPTASAGVALPATLPQVQANALCFFTTGTVAITNLFEFPERCDSTGNLLVNLQTALPAGGNTIGAVNQAGTWNIGTVTTVTTLSTLTSITNPVAVTESGTWTVGLTNAAAAPLPTASAGAAEDTNAIPVKANDICFFTNGTVAVTAQNQYTERCDSTGHLLISMFNPPPTVMPGTPSPEPTQSSLPVVAHNVGLASAGYTPYLNCDKTATIALTASGTLQVVALSGTTVIYVCGFHFVTDAATKISWSGGTGTNCATGQTWFEATSTATGMGFAANQGMVVTPTGIPIFKTAAGSELCLQSTATANIYGTVEYAQM